VALDFVMYAFNIFCLVNLNKNNMRNAGLRLHFVKKEKKTRGTEEVALLTLTSALHNAAHSPLTISVQIPGSVP
jgi:large-conductance mechanosensitive channel